MSTTNSQNNQAGARKISFGSSSEDETEKLPGISNIIAVGSAKGGVGKSTVSVNLAFALQQMGNRVGLLDADILGPSIPVMLGLATDEPPEMNADEKLIPAERYDLKVISMGMLTSDDNPAVMRGPMVGKYLHLFLSSVQWGELDYLVIDLPPGTGDIQLTLAQSIPLSGAVVVTTPQDVSLKIARRGLRMFEKVQVPILGIVENMGTFSCPHCGKGTDIFRGGGGERMSRELDVPFLGAIPLDADVVTAGDEGRPLVLDKPDSSAAKAYLAIAGEVSGQLQGLSTAGLRPFNWIWESDEGAPDWQENAIQPSGSAINAIGFRKRDPRTLSVLWEDGQQNDLDVRDLRLACKCALCKEEMTGRPLLDPKTIPADVTPRTISSLGNYAIKITWNDGHSSGIDTFRHLREFSAGATGEVDDV